MHLLCCRATSTIMWIPSRAHISAQMTMPMSRPVRWWKFVDQKRKRVLLITIGILPAHRLYIHNRLWYHLNANHLNVFEWKKLQDDFETNLAAFSYFAVKYFSVNSSVCTLVLDSVSVTVLITNNRNYNSRTPIWRKWIKIFRKNFGC